MALATAKPSTLLIVKVAKRAPTSSTGAAHKQPSVVIAPLPSKSRGIDMRTYHRHDNESVPCHLSKGRMATLQAVLVSSILVMTSCSPPKQQSARLSQNELEEPKPPPPSSRPINTIQPKDAPLAAAAQRQAVELFDSRPEFHCVWNSNVPKNVKPPSVCGPSVSVCQELEKLLTSAYEEVQANDRPDLPNPTPFKSSTCQPEPDPYCFLQHVRVPCHKLQQHSSCRNVSQSSAFWNAKQPVWAAYYVCNRTELECKQGRAKYRASERAQDPEVFTIEDACERYSSWRRRNIDER